MTLQSAESGLDKAERRIASLRSIDPNLDLGGGLTLGLYSQKADLLRSEVANYNESLSYSDRALNRVQETEQEMRNLSERMLIAVAAKYGKDSHEYEMAGGTRKSERKRPRRQSSQAAIAQ